MVRENEELTVQFELIHRRGKLSFSSSVLSRRKSSVVAWLAVHEVAQEFLPHSAN